MQTSLLREALEEERKDVGDFWLQGGWRWEEGVWGPWSHILPLSEAGGVDPACEPGGAWGCGLGESVSCTGWGLLGPWPLERVF